MKPVPSPEVVFGERRPRLARVGSVAETVLQSLSTAASSRVSRELDRRYVGQAVERAEGRALEFVNAKGGTVKAAPHGLEMAAQGHGFTVNVHAEAQGQEARYPHSSPDSTHWVMRVLNDKTGNVSLFDVRTSRSRRDIPYRQSSVHITVMNPETGKAYNPDFGAFNHRDTVAAYESVGDAFDVLAAADREGTLHTEVLAKTPLSNIPTEVPA